MNKHKHNNKHMSVCVFYKEAMNRIRRPQSDQEKLDEWFDNVVKSIINDNVWDQRLETIIKAINTNEINFSSYILESYPSENAMYPDCGVFWKVVNEFIINNPDKYTYKITKKGHMLYNYTIMLKLSKNKGFVNVTNNSGSNVGYSLRLVLPVKENKEKCIIL